MSDEQPDPELTNEKPEMLTREEWLTAKAIDTMLEANSLLLSANAHLERARAWIKFTAFIVSVSLVLILVTQVQLYRRNTILDRMDRSVTFFCHVFEQFNEGQSCNTPIKEGE